MDDIIFELFLKAMAVDRSDKIHYHIECTWHGCPKFDGVLMHGNDDPQYMRRELRVY